MLNRAILEVTFLGGSYGMGGYGFLGFRLGTFNGRPTEWLMCTLFAAEQWFVVDGRWPDASPGQNFEQRPLVGQTARSTAEGLSLPGEPWDDFTPVVIGVPIHRFEIEEKSCRLEIGNITLALSDDPITRPHFAGTGQPRILGTDDDLRRAWILAHQPVLTL